MTTFLFAFGLLVLIVLIASTIVCWALFEQAGASMTLFADRVMERTAFGIEFNIIKVGKANFIKQWLCNIFYKIGLLNHWLESRLR